MKTIRNTLLYGLATSVVLALLLAWTANRFGSVLGWLSFLSVILVTAGLAAGVFSALRREKPPAWLVRLTIGAALLRLAAGAAWFILLPAFGYDTDVQQAGYIMADAFDRDTAAWDLANGDTPLWAAFRSADFNSLRGADQYGGLLFISALVYRSLGAGLHQPLLMVVLSAGVSALTVPLGWAFTRRFFDEDTARLSAWVLAVFPEAVLLGGSQMREAWAMPLAAAALYGITLYSKGPRQDRAAALAWLLLPLLVLLPLSPPYTAILLVLVALVGLGLDRWRIFRSWRLWFVLGGAALVVLAVVWMGWDQIAPRLHAEAFDSPLEMAGYWFELSARWQARQSENASGWLQRIFEQTPEWVNLPFLMAYGVTRPLLPAQLFAGGLPIWWLIGVWRAAGWAVLLILLIIAPVQMLRSGRRPGPSAALTLAAWLTVLVASFWGGGDQWDNPRYRVAFIITQAAVGARVYLTNRTAPDPLLRRAAIVVFTVLAWFIPWYLRRYTVFDQFFGWTVVDVFKLLGAGVFTGVLLAVWDWMKEKY